MDSLTHVLVGAAVGEATLGRRVGNKAMAWGAVAATVPDLDVLAYPFLRQVQEIYMHRGVTHSLLFGVVSSLAFGYLVLRLYRGRDSSAAAVGWQGWSLLFGLSFLSHLILDLLTVYGTQVLWPFSDTPFAYPVLFIIDPLYTVWFLVAVPAILWLRHRARQRGGDIQERTRRALLVVALGVSSVYVGWAMAARAVVQLRAERMLAQSEVRYERLHIGPGPLTTLAWHVIADQGESFLVGTLSLLDGDAQPRFRHVPAMRHLAAEVDDTLAMERLRWFTRGYYIVRPDTLELPEARRARGEQSSGVLVADPRFGRNDAWMTDDPSATYVFQWRIVREADGRYDLRQFRPPFMGVDGALNMYARRVAGKRSEAGY